MKYFSLLLFALVLTTATSCGGDEEVMEPEKTGNCLTAKIDGADFTATTATATAIDTTIEWNGSTDQETQILTIIGSIPSLSANTQTITLTFACSQLVSDLDYVDTDQSCGIGMAYNITNFSDPNGAIIMEATSGNIQIEEVSDAKIKGTFSFTGADQNGTEYTITDGFFDTTIN